MLESIKSRVSSAISEAQTESAEVLQTARETVVDKIEHTNDAAINLGTEKAITVLKKAIEKIKNDKDMQWCNSACIETKVHLGVVEIGISLTIDLRNAPRDDIKRDGT